MLIPWWLIITVPLTAIAIKMRGKPKISEDPAEDNTNENPLSPKDALIIFGFMLLIISFPLILIDSFIDFMEWLQFDAIRDLMVKVFGTQLPKPPPDPTVLLT